MEVIEIVIQNLGCWVASAIIGSAVGGALFVYVQKKFDLFYHKK